MIYLGADHGGFLFKETLKQWLDKWGLPYQDMGNTDFDEKDDYPQYAMVVAKKVAEDESQENLPSSWKDRSKGILSCRSGAGMVIAANKVKGARAVGVFDPKQAQHAREHNDANIIAISGDYTDQATAKLIIETFLNTEFSGEERHKKRLNQITEFEKKNFV
jgi:ribose 5-phosphate isomerase B